MENEISHKKMVPFHETGYNPWQNGWETLYNPVYDQLLCAAEVLGTQNKMEENRDKHAAWCLGLMFDDFGCLKKKWINILISHFWKRDVEMCAFELSKEVPFWVWDDRCVSFKKGQMFFWSRFETWFYHTQHCGCLIPNLVSIVHFEVKLQHQLSSRSLTVRLWTSTGTQKEGLVFQVPSVQSLHSSWWGKMDVLEMADMSHQKKVPLRIRSMSHPGCLMIGAL